MDKLAGGMAPDFFNGSLIRHFGTLQVMGAGLLLNLVCIEIATRETGLDDVFPRCSWLAWDGIPFWSALVAGRVAV